MAQGLFLRRIRIILRLSHIYWDSLKKRPQSPFGIGAPDGALVQGNCKSKGTPSGKVLKTGIICTLEWFQGMEILTFTKESKVNEVMPNMWYLFLKTKISLGSSDRI